MLYFFCIFIIFQSNESVLEASKNDQEVLYNYELILYSYLNTYICCGCFDAQIVASQLLSCCCFSVCDMIQQSLIASLLSGVAQIHLTYYSPFQTWTQQILLKPWPLFLLVKNNIQRPQARQQVHLLLLGCHSFKVFSMEGWKNIFLGEI